MAQIHKQFSTEQVKDLFKRCMDKQIERQLVVRLLFSSSNLLQPSL